MNMSDWGWGMGGAMAIWWTLLWVVLALAIAALVKYLFKRRD